MKSIISQIIVWVITVVLCGIFVGGTAIAHELLDPIQEILNNFPNSVVLKKDKRTALEFCPDNTCDVFISNRETSLVDLKDFAYLFIFFYSDYYVLQDWRNKESATKMMRLIISKPQYQSCRKTTEHETARCILIQLSNKGRIKSSAIRYDENKRNVTDRNLMDELSRAPIIQTK